MDLIGTKVLRVFLLAFTHSPLLTDFTPPPPPSKSGLKLVCNVNIVYGNIKSAQKPQQNGTFMNYASGMEFIDSVLQSLYKHIFFLKDQFLQWINSVRHLCLFNVYISKYILYN